MPTITKESLKQAQKLMSELDMDYLFVSRGKHFYTTYENALLNASGKKKSVITLKKDLK